MISLLLLPMLVYIAIRDLKSRTIPNMAIILIAALGIGNIVLQQIYWTAALFRLLPALFLFVAAIIKDGCQGGDVKLYAALCLFSAPLRSLIVLLTAFLIVIIVSKITKSRSFPFAPYLCGSFLLFSIL